MISLIDRGSKKKKARSDACQLAFLSVIYNPLLLTYSISENLKRVVLCDSKP